jgi:hypothetical protein
MLPLIRCDLKVSASTGAPTVLGDGKAQALHENAKCILRKGKDKECLFHIERWPDPDPARGSDRRRDKGPKKREEYSRLNISAKEDKRADFF